MQIEGSMMTAKEIRNALENRYPDVTDSEFNIAQSRFALRTSADCYRSRFDLCDRPSYD
jgi:hypothetical protein